MPNYSNLIDRRELLDFSQNFGVSRNYLGSRLFPDRKTEYIEQEFYRLCENGNLPVSAQVHAMDSEARIGSRIPLEKVNVEELLIKEKINVTEEMRRQTHGMTMGAESLREYVFDDVARMAERVVTRVERAKMDAIALGKFTIEENNLDFDIDYGIPSEHFVTSDWSDADADILGDVRKWRKLAIDKGYTPNVAITSETVLTYIMQNATIQKAIFGTSGTGILPTLDQVNALFRSQFSGLSIETNDARYSDLVTVDGKLKNVGKRYFPENKFVMAATGINGTLGTGLWGVTPEEAEQGGAFDTKRQQQFVTVVTYSTPDPVATWTKASGMFMAVLPNPYGHVIASVTTADGSEG